MEKYCCITSVRFDSSKKFIQGVMGYFTTLDHSLFFPPQEFSRYQLFEMLKNGDVLFTSTSNRSQNILRVIRVMGFDFIRIDKNPVEADYLGTIGTF